jgi:GAF domain-containing protein
MAGQDILVDAFVDLTETMVVNFDLVEFLHELTVRCGLVLDADVVGLMLADNRDQLRLIASSSEQTHLLDFRKGNADDGPGLVAFQTGQTVSCPDLTLDDQGWPGFGDQVRDAGFRAVHAVPMRLHAEIVGVISLFYRSPTDLPAAGARTARALADVATVGLVQQRAIRERHVLAEQVQSAFDDRVLVELAKGVLAERLHIGVDEAFAAMRHHAGSSDRRLTDLALRLAVAVDEPSGITWPIRQ